MWQSRGINTLPGKALQNPRRNELPEEQILLVGYGGKMLKVNIAP